MNDSRRFLWLPVPSVLLAIVSAQGGAAIAKSLLPVLGVIGTAGVRTALSAAMLMLVYRPPLWRFTAGQWRAVVPYGLTLGTMNLLFYWAIARIPLGVAVTLEFVGPLALAVVASRRAADLLWVAMAAAGIALIAPWNGGSVDPTGALFALAAGGAWAAYIVLGGRVSRVLPSGSAVAVGMLFAAVVILPFALAHHGIAHFTPRMLGMGAALALLSSALPFTLEMNAMRVMPARTFSILMSLEPAVAATAGCSSCASGLAGRSGWRWRW